MINGCQHAFCRECIQTALQQSRGLGRVATCPTCKTPFTRRSVMPAPTVNRLVRLYKLANRSLGLAPLVPDPTLAMTQYFPATQTAAMLAANSISSGSEILELNAPR